MFLLRKLLKFVLFIMLSSKAFSIAETQLTMDEMRGYIYDDRVDEILTASSELREGKPGEDTEVVIIGGGPTGSMSALSAIQSGINPDNIKIVEFREEYTRNNLVYGLDVSEWPIDIDKTAPVIEYFQRINLLERSFRVVLEEMGVAYLTFAAADVCAPEKKVILVSADERRAVRDLTDFCDAYREDEGATSLTVGGQSFDIIVIEYDMLVLAAGGASHKFLEEGDVKAFYDAAQDSYDSNNDDELFKLISTAIHYRVKKIDDTVPSTGDAPWNCYNGDDPGDSEDEEEEDICTVYAELDQFMVEAPPESCYLVFDFDNISPMDEAWLESLSEDPVGIIKSRFPAQENLDDTIEIIQGASTFNDDVYFVNPSIRVPDSGEGKSFITCEGDCAASPYYQEGQGLTNARDGVLKTKAVFEFVVSNSINDEGLEAVVDSVQTSRYKSHLSKAQEYCYKTGKKVYESWEGEKNQNRAGIKEACKQACLEFSSEDGDCN